MTTDNLYIYNQARSVPQEAQKEIKAGRLKGMTDINPMWRIKKLTELFGPCGVGWKYRIVSYRLEESPTKEIAAFLEITLQVKTEGEWSQEIPGVGGSAFAVQEKSGMHMNDECLKMALTDAISEACKALGIGADVYYAKDRSKYVGGQGDGEAPPAGGQTPPPAGLVCFSCGKNIKDVQTAGGETFSAVEIARLSQKNYGHPLCWDCALKAKAYAKKDGAQ